MLCALCVNAVLKEAVLSIEGAVEFLGHVGFRRKVCAMEEFYVIGDFRDSRDPSSFQPAERDLPSIDLALDVLAKQEQDVAMVEKLHADEIKERQAEGRADEARRRIEMDKKERVEREAAKVIVRQRQAARELEAKEAKKRQKQTPMDLSPSTAVAQAEAVAAASPGGGPVEGGTAEGDGAEGSA